MPADSLRGSSGFPAHGRSEFHADGAIIRIAVEGPFNVEGIEAFGRKMIALFADIPPGRAVVSLAEIRGTLLAPPDAWALLEAHTRRVQQGPHRVLATAWVVAPDVEGRALMIPRARRMYADAGREFEVFTDDEAAGTWARERLERQ